MNDNSPFKLFVDGFIDDFLELLSNYVTDFIYSGEKKEDKTMDKAEKQVEDLIKKIDEFNITGVSKNTDKDARIALGDKFAKDDTQCVIYNLKRSPEFKSWIEKLVADAISKETKDIVKTESESDAGYVSSLYKERHDSLIKWAANNNRYWESYGVPITSLCIEEMSELAQALLKREREWKTDVIHYDTEVQPIIDEMGDVYICLEMIRQHYDISEAEIWERIKFKCNEKYKEE